MRNIITSAKIGKKFCTISASRLIIAAVFVLLLASCSGIHSVRTDYSKRGKEIRRPIEKKENKKAEQNEELSKKIESAYNLNSEKNAGKEIELDPVAYNETFIDADKPAAETDKTDDGQTVLKYNKRLPTLREQMAMNKEDQNEIRNDVDLLQKDVEEIKLALDEIKKGMAFISSGEMPVPKKGPDTGNEQIEKQNIQPNIILSDEAIAAKKSDIQRKPANKTRKPAVNNNRSEQHTSNSQETSIPKQQASDYSDNSDPLSLPEFKLAMNEFQQKDFNSTIKQLNDIIRENPGKVVVVHCHYWMGESYYGLKQYGEAVLCFKKVLHEKGIQEKKPDAQIMIAESFIRSGETNAAKDAFRKLISDYPKCEYVPRARKMLQQL